MAKSFRAPKQRCLIKVESINSSKNWKQNLQYIFSLYPKFTPFLTGEYWWDKKTKSAPLRGFYRRHRRSPLSRRKTAQQKVNVLELILWQVANYCPVLSRNTIVRNSTSIQSMWQTILHYGFQSSGSHFLDLAETRLCPDYKPLVGPGGDRNHLLSSSSALIVGNAI